MAFTPPGWKKRLEKRGAAWQRTRLGYGLPYGAAKRISDGLPVLLASLTRDLPGSAAKRLNAR